MTEIIAPGAFTTAPEIEPPKTKLSRLPRAPGIAAEPRQVPTDGKVTFVRIGLSDEDLKKLEEKAKELGLEVPEELKRGYTVRSEGADLARKKFQDKLNAFLDELKKKWEEKQKEKQKNAQSQQSQKQTTNQQIDQETQVVGYEIGLSDGDLQKLEEAAEKVGLKVPDALKQKRTVKPEEKDKALQDFQSELNKFLEQLQQAYSKKEYQAWLDRARGFAMSYQERHPGAHVFINDAGFITVIEPKPAPTLNVDAEAKAIEKETQAINEDQLFKEARGKKLLQSLNTKLDIDLGGSCKVIDEETGEFLNTSPDKILVDVNPENFKNPRARSRGLSLHTEIDLNKGEENLNKDLNIDYSMLPTLYADQTKTFWQIQQEQEALNHLYTASGMIADELGLDYDNDDSAVEKFGKGLVRGAIGFFTFPVDLVMIASQWDKIQRWADAQNESVARFLAENLKESVKDPGFWGEVAGSALVGGALSAARKAFTTRVIETPVTVTGTRELSKIISTPTDDIFRFTNIGDDLYRVTVETNPVDDFARLSSVETFKLNQLHRVTIKQTPFQKSIKVETIPTDFRYSNIRSLLGKNSYTGRTATMSVDMRSGRTLLNLAELAQKNADDILRQVQVETWTNPDDILKFVDDAMRGSSNAPNVIIRKTKYLPDEGLAVTSDTGLSDEGLTHLKVKVKPFSADDILDDINKMTRRFDEIASPDDFESRLNYLGELTESGKLPGQDVNLKPSTKPKTTFKVEKPDVVIKKIDKDVSKALDDISKTSTATGKESSSALLQLPRSDQLLDEATWEVKVSRAGPVKTMEIRPPRYVGAPSDLLSMTLDKEIQKDMNVINTSTREMNLHEVIADQGQGQKEKQRSKTRVSYNLDYEVRTILDQATRQVPDFRVGIMTRPLTATVTKTKTKTIPVTTQDLDLDVRVIQDEMTRLTQEMRQLYHLESLLDEEPTPRPRKKTKIKQRKKPRPKPSVQKKKKSPKRKSKKSKGGEWGVWIGYESLLDI